MSRLTACATIVAACVLVLVDQSSAGIFDKGVKMVLKYKSEPPVVEHVTVASTTTIDAIFKSLLKKVDKEGKKYPKDESLWEAQEQRGTVVPPGLVSHKNSVAKGGLNGIVFTYKGQ